MGWYAKERARERIADLAGMGLDLPTFWREATQLVATAVPHYQSPCWYTLDPASLLITSHYQSELPELPAEWVAQEYYEDDFHSISSVARSKEGISTLHDATGGDPSRSPRWHANRELGGDQELLVALRTAPGEPWGLVGLYREPDRPLVGVSLLLRVKTSGVRTLLSPCNRRPVTACRDEPLAAPLDNSSLNVVVSDPQHDDRNWMLPPGWLAWARGRCAARRVVRPRGPVVTRSARQVDERPPS